MNAVATVNVQSLVEHIRLLEALVTSPLGLYSDIRMLREALPFADAGELPREELRERRGMYARLAEDKLALALNVIASVDATLALLGGMRGDDGGLVLSDDWVRRAGMVLRRAEEHVGGEMRTRVAAKVRGLYVIVDPEVTGGRDVLEVADAALRGGVSVLQLRDKSRDKGAVVETARELQGMCEGYGALFVVNDDADVAVASGAGGLHVGQTDLAVGDARRVLGAGQIVGRSNNGVDEAVESEGVGADYVAVGAVFPTTTMGKSGRTAVGVGMIGRVKGMVSQPVVAIGGIDASNIGEVVRAGADCVCVVSAVTGAGDPAAAAGRLVGLMGGG